MHLSVSYSTRQQGKYQTLSIAEMKYHASTIRDMNRDRQDALVVSAIRQLAMLDLSVVPGNKRLFHSAVLVYWALAATVK
jgi:hypothetical protein